MSVLYESPYQRLLRERFSPAPVQPVQQPLRPLSPQEEESFLSRVGGKTLGGLAYVGSVLDKQLAGRAVRGLLGGKPRELLSVIPLSDTFDITDEADRVSGVDLLRNAGVVDEGDSGLGTTLAGIATEVALSPATYLTFGSSALTGAGQTAAKIGALPATTLGRIRGLTALEPLAAARAAEVGIDAASILNKPLGGVAGLGLPFRNASVVLGAGPGGEAFVKGVGKVASLGRNLPVVKPTLDFASRTLEPVGRGFRALFDPSRAGALSPWGQAEGPALVEGIEQGSAQIRGALGGLMAQAKPAELLTPEGGAVIRRVGELAGRQHGPLTAQEQVASTIAGKIESDLLGPLRADLDELGHTPGVLVDEYINYGAPRHLTPLERQTIGYGGGKELGNLKPGALKGRDPALVNVPGGTELGVNPASVDPNISGVYGRYAPTPPRPPVVGALDDVGEPVLAPGTVVQPRPVRPMAPGEVGPPAPVTTPLERAAYIREKYLGGGPEDEAAMIAARQAGTDAGVLRESATRAEMEAEQLLAGAPGPTGVVPPGPEDVAAAQALLAQGNTLREQARLVDQYNRSVEFERIVGNLDPRRATQGVPMFSNHPLDDVAQTAEALNRVKQSSIATHNLLSKAATTAEQAGPGAVPLLDTAFLGELGFTNIAKAQQQLTSRLAARVPGLTDEAMNAMYVPKAVADDARRFLNGYATPRALEPLINAINSFTNLTKTFQTSPWPAFHVRNKISGMWQNWVMGARDPRFGGDPVSFAKSFLQPELDAQAVLRGGVVEGLENLPLFKQAGATTAEAATEMLRRLAYQYRATSQGTHIGSEVLGGSSTAADFAARVPGWAPFQGILKTAKQGVTGPFRPLAEGETALGRVGETVFGASGVGPFTKDVSAPIKAGREIGTFVEDTNRLSGFIAKLRQGYHPEQAAMEVRAAQVDYSALTPFERAVMRKVIPFYTYSRRIIPYTLERLVREPGGLGGSAALAAYTVRQQDDRFLPPWLGGGLAIPVGEEEAGTQRFLTKIDTPIETAAELIKPGAQPTWQSLLSQTNPIIKGPLELAAGKQFFTGRDLGDLYTMTGSTAADQLLMNSPLSRFVTSYRTVADPRKSWATTAVNLGTGVRLTDIDMERQRDIAARELVADALRGQEGVGRYESVYQRPGAVLTPEQTALLRLQRGLEQRARQRATIQPPGPPR